MRRLFVVLVLLVIGVAALGYYRGWFTLDWEKRPDGKGQVTGTVDQEKIEEDKKQAVEQVRNLGGQKATATEKGNDGNTKSKQP